MTDLLLSVLLSGFAVTYVLEFIDLFDLINKSTLNRWLALPLSFAGIYILLGELYVEMIVAVPATTFVSLALMKFLNKPTIVQQRVPRI
jgi:hypothetical protein